jgi:hypothetical protein
MQTGNIHSAMDPPLVLEFIPASAAPVEVLGYSFPFLNRQLAI